MIIGIPGSGKSTMAKQIAKHWEFVMNEKIKIFEADMFFEKDGKYNWQREKLKEAHNWCKAKVENELKDDHSVIVANTFITPSERLPYLILAKKYNAEVSVLTCTGEFKNVHGVSDETIQKMKKKFQYYSINELESLV